MLPVCPTRRDLYACSGSTADVRKLMRDYSILAHRSDNALNLKVGLSGEWLVY